MDKNLYDYQRTIVLEISKSRNHTLLISPTGSGKTRMISNSVKNMNASVIAFSHRIEIRKQIEKEFTRVGIKKFIVASTNSRKALAEIKNYDIAFIDEAHHSPASTFKRIFDECVANNVRVIGATATPYRSDNVSIEPFFQHIVKAPSVDDLSSKGYLARLRYVSADGVDFYKEKKNVKEEIEDDLYQNVRAVVIASNVSMAWRKYAPGKKAIIYCVNKEHCEITKNELRSLGHRVDVVTADTGKRERSKLIQDFSSGILHGLINCQVFTEGTDLPMVGAIIMLKPTLSRALYKQMIGRGLRPDTNCVVLDHVGNCNMHGNVMQEDEIIEMKKGKDIPVKQKESQSAIEPMKLVIHTVDAEMSDVWLPEVFEV